MRIENRDRDREIKNPLREFANTRENVKRNATKRVIKNSGITPKVCGSTK